MSITRIKGFADMFPPESDTFTRLENTAREVFFRYGFVELRTPIVEFTELFQRSIGEETEPFAVLPACWRSKPHLSWN